jgi:hypothetical protein
LRDVEELPHENFPLPAQSIVTAAVAPTTRLMAVLVGDANALPFSEHSFG